MVESASRTIASQGPLEAYLSGSYRDDLQELDTLDRTLRLAASTFVATFVGDQWPYEFKTEPSAPAPITSKKFSQGTAAMALCATGKLLGKCEPQAQDVGLNSELANHWNASAKALRRDLRVQKESYRGSGRAYVRSSSFGNENAMTASHLAELMSALRQPEQAVMDDIRQRLQPLLGNFQAALGAVEKHPNLISIPSDRGAYQRNSFVPLRALKTCLWMEPSGSFGHLRGAFESALHDQLSFSAIPDSRFDPAELLFCLEGLLLCANNAVDEPLFERVLVVLVEKQSTSAHWRPNKPFLASDRGAIFLPLSVEGANSLMRSAEIMDVGRRHDLFASRCLPLLRRFWSWLLARSVRFTRDGHDCIGWHSEHVNAPELIHLWDTSQVVEFMIAYQRLLHRHIAHRTLALSGVHVRYPKDLRESLNWKEVRKPEWSDVVTLRDPVRTLAGQYEVYKRVGEDFVNPRCNRPGTPLFSMLLYGPPGTGKSSLAKFVADALSWPLVTVTVSDFLGSGGAMVEARAKAVFEMLEAQIDCVILFDEIDAFLLDRDSKFYRDQDTLFQFLTPGMLTKLNDLRSAKRSIFIVATNYANRIDPAIKRLGRIDRQFLVLPPDRMRRKEMLAGLRIPARSREAASKRSLYLGWSDLEAAANEFRKGGRILDILDRANRSTGPAHYGRRVWTDKSFPDEEAGCLYQLGLEAQDKKFKTHFMEGAKAAYDGDDFQKDKKQAEAILVRVTS